MIDFKRFCNRLVLRVLPLIIACFYFQAAAYALQPGDHAPPLPQISGQQSSAGKIVFLDFWASWCGPCRLSLPWIAKLSTKFPAESFQVVSVNVDNDRANADKLLGELKITLPVIYDPEAKLADSYGVNDMPSTFIIKADGSIAEVLDGYYDSEKQEVESKIKVLLKEAKK